MPRRRVARRCEHRAVGVEHADLVDRQARHRGGDEMADRLRRRRIGRHLRADDDGGRGRLPAAPERARLRQHDMHARRLDALHGLDRARKLALEARTRVTSCMNDVRPIGPSLSNSS